MPTTPLGALIVPNTGDLSGTWGSAAVNPNFTAIDAIQRGAVSLSLSAATTFTLSAPAGSITPGAGPTQSQNAILKFTGTLSGNAEITLPLPGYYTAINNCVVGSPTTGFFVRLRAVGASGVIGLPPGQPIQVWCDGTDVGFVGLPVVGEIIYTTYSATPQWMNACTTSPFLTCDGTVYSISAFPTLGAQLGSTYGGNGATTFGVPDLRGRYPIPIDSTGTRITSASSGINGATSGAQGGSQLLQTHTHTNTLTDPQHSHIVAYGAGINFTRTAADVAVTTINVGQANLGNSNATATGITINNAASGSGGSGNIPPAQVVGVAMIKT